MEATSISIKSIIEKKKEGKSLTKEDIEFFVCNLTKGNRVTPKQIGALLMACCLKKMDCEETCHLTHAMIESGEKLTWPEDWQGCIVDKHSTGGIGDKVSLILAPALAACRMKVPMISGRALGHTGGTLNKLESIPGFEVDPDKLDTRRILQDVGCFIVSQSELLAPADRVIYQSRDETCTVDDCSLITGSILSKKAVEGINALILDVKFGKAAFMKNIVDAEKMAQLMVNTSSALKIKTKALVTSMDSPLGRMASNGILEVVESVQSLQGNGPADLMELVYYLGGHLLNMTGKVSSLKEGTEQIKKTMEDGSALNKFHDMLLAQNCAEDIAKKLCGKNPWEVFQESGRTAKHTTPVICEKNGYIHGIDANLCGQVITDLGAFTVNNPEDHGVGLEFLVSVGDYIEKDQAWVKVHHNFNSGLEQLKRRLQTSIDIQKDKVPDISRIKNTISAQEQTY